MTGPTAFSCGADLSVIRVEEEWSEDEMAIFNDFEEGTPQDDEEEFLTTRLSFAVVFKASLAEIQEIKQHLKKFSRNVVSQKTSSDYLYIVPKKEKKATSSRR